HRLLVILEGESLFNDASALLVYRLAVAAAVAGSFSAWSALPLLAVVSLGSVLVGAILSRLLLFIVGRIRDVATSVIIQFVGTFAVWILAERLRLSGIITIVSFAIATARSSPARMPARLRIPSYAVWDVVVFVLNVLAFILVGLQLGPILQRLDRPRLHDYHSTAAAVLRDRDLRSDGVCPCIRDRGAAAPRRRSPAVRCARVRPLCRRDRLERHARHRHPRRRSRAACLVSRA